jgi:hypothetical protein
MAGFEGEVFIGTQRVSGANNNVCTNASDADLRPFYALQAQQPVR